MHTWTLFSLLNRCQTSSASSISSLCLFYCPFLLFFFYSWRLPFCSPCISFSPTLPLTIFPSLGLLDRCRSVIVIISARVRKVSSRCHMWTQDCAASLSPPTSPALISLMLPFTATSSSLPSFQTEEQSVDIGVGPNMSSTWLRGGNESQEKQPGSESDN